ncbi:sialate O-acetylesterase [Fulvivirgaceae bacterium PWU5]|uniref:Sialate O-acetylesterase n=1 Tax=Dawidia cretensis TaxID=2782350 RepID=A0AAP2E4I1_9BACT|nr:sialate O-acetylesterase [Dawidia cretensis]MBT1712104.1 sialate O-acetylesterase [Dawidia cretensis]
MRWIIVVFAICLLSNTWVSAQVRLPAIVRDSMVVQRDTRLKIWGWASPGERVQVVLNKRRYNATAEADGTWAVWVAPLQAGGPYMLDIQGSNTITLRNILAGDVWLCAGQSNMVHSLALHRERYAKEIAQANYPQIRNFTVPVAATLQGPRETLSGGRWKSANPSDVKGFSVVAYFFARALYEKYRVPVGIIHASVGGSPIETWTSEEGLRAFPETMVVLQQNKDSAYVNRMNRDAGARHDAWERVVRSEAGFSVTAPDETKTKDWRAIYVPGYWEDQGVQDLDGIVRYRREIVLPASAAGKAARLALGRIVDADDVYINGVAVGHTGYQYPQRRYSVPAGVLKAGKNILTVRVTNYHGKGGFVPDKPYRLIVENDTVDLTGYWRYKVDVVFHVPEPVAETIPPRSQPAALFNGMIAPLTSYAIKGIVWYQGESNTSDAGEYRKLLPALIADWRRQWRHDDLPFLFVQLPNFNEMNYLPEESQWASLREAQRQALRVPRTAMVVTIDLGEWNDIHPGNKRPIGERLALAARRLVYDDRQVVSSGPVFQQARAEGRSIILSFSETGTGLTTSDGEAPGQFAVAGMDKVFKWAEARIVNNEVVVSSEFVEQPVYIRYAWGDNPAKANLVNREGLPASPFEDRLF